MKLYILKLVILFAIASILNAQEAKVRGNFQYESQYYRQDSSIGAAKVPEGMLSQGFINMIYTQGGLEIGMRYEAFLNPLLGYPTEYKNSGVAYRYVTYRSQDLDITGGSFYEQFGSGMIFRAYEERALGIDNMIDGMRAKFRPTKGIEMTALFGKQRQFWGQSDGVIRAGDININVNEIYTSLLPDDINLTIGGSAVSRFQQDLQSTYNLPLNVFGYATRAALTGSNFSFDMEYASKENDPNATNKYSFNPGTGLLLNASYFESGLSASLNFHRIDNMDFRSSRDVLGNKDNLNYIPAITRQHTYRVLTNYVFATQLNGEIGLQGEITYKFAKGSTLGGDYGTNININFSRVNALDTSHTPIPVGSKLDEGFKYDSPFFKVGKRTYFQDINVEISKKMSNSYKNTLTIVNLVYDRDILESSGANITGKVFATGLIYEGLIKMNESTALRFELQHLWSRQEKTPTEIEIANGNWMFGLAELSFSPHWFVSVYNEYNYGNVFDTKKLHYLNFSAAYLVNSTRLSLNFGKQKSGLICVGGVCRPVPASNGLYFVISSSF